VVSIVAWWLALSAMGWLSWPLAFAIVRRSPGRGYAFSRAVGLLILSYVYWLLGVLGLVPNRADALWGVWAGLALLGVLVGLRQRGALHRWLAREWRDVLTVELLFALTLAVYAVHKAFDPAIDHTEEPMDFAFLNGILRSPHMPPNDPWLSGHAISYYYLGYLTVAALTRLTGLPSGVGYNLGLAYTLALTVIGAYGVLDGLLRSEEERPCREAAWAIAGALAIAFAGNLEGILEGLRALGLGPEGLYRWLDVPGLADAPRGVGWLPAGRWWWWRASRVIYDHNFVGRGPTVITEFPVFSLILGDLHPHVMSLPYFILAIGLAAELFRLAREGSFLSGSNWATLAPLPVLYGALGLLNSWDLPTALALSVSAYALGSWRGRRDVRRWARDTLVLVLWLVAGSSLLYLPFYRALQTQAQGLGLAYYTVTPLKHYLICLGPWALPMLADALDAATRLGTAWEQRTRRRLVWGVGLAILLLPWLATLLLGGWGKLLLGVLVALWRGPWGLLLQGALLTVWVLDIAAWTGDAGKGDGRRTLPLGRLLLLTGVALTYVVEFLYVRDMFNTRMNTVFKLTYQAWALLGLGSALTAQRLWGAGGWRRAAVGLSAAVLCASLYYPIAAAYTRAEGYRGAPTLDGTAFLRDTSPDEYGAYLWLREHARPGDVLAEAVGEEYDADTNRLSSWTGVPTILGWPGHEAQWRGDESEVLRRLPEVARLYVSTDAEEVLSILRRYGVTYLYVGPYERRKHAIGDDRLAWYATFLDEAYAQGAVRLYAVR